MCKISIIVPVYNVKKYLKRCIDSILAQSFKDFQVILVDDGSNDGSGKVCDQYAREDKRVHVLHKVNGGVSSARNAGLEIASGKYVIFCDGDDSWKPDLLENVYNVINERNVDSVVFNYTRIEDLGEKKESHFSLGLYEFERDSKKIEYLIKEFMMYKHGYEVWTRLFRREIIEENHILFCLTCNNFAEDIGFIMKYILYSKNFFVIDECYYNYYVNSGSMMDRSKKIVRLNEINEVSYYVCESISSDDFSEEYKNNFCILHFLLLYNQYCKVIWKPIYSQLAMEIEKIQKKKWYKKQIRQLFHRYGLLKYYFGKKDAKRILLFSHYCLHGNWKLFSIESYLIYKFLI